MWAVSEIKNELMLATKKKNTTFLKLERAREGSDKIPRLMWNLESF